MQTVYLTRRNLLTLLSKLDRVRAGDQSLCTIVKGDTTHPKFPCSDQIKVVAIEDEAYYTDRLAGDIHSMDELTLMLAKAKGTDNAKGQTA